MTAPRIGAVVLAAGASTRMGPGNKLLADLDGRPLVRTVVATALASPVDPVIVVVGEAEEIGEAIPDGAVVVENPESASGLASSLSAGVRALPGDVEGVVVLLGDMPLVGVDDVTALIARFDPDAPCLPVVDGRWANPVLWPRAYFPRILELEGDRGARRILEADPERVVEVERDNPGLLFDIDTREDLARARGSAARRHR